MSVHLVGFRGVALPQERKDVTRKRRRRKEGKEEEMVR